MLVPIYNKTSLVLYKPFVLVGLIYKDLLAAKDLVSFSFQFVDNSLGLEYIKMLVNVFFHLFLELTLEIVTM